MSDKKVQDGKPKVSKRQALREERARKQRQQRIFWIVGMVLVALIGAGLLIYPSFRNATSPVGEIVKITPKSMPMANGTALGNPNAKVKIETWEDFQCPSCRSYSETVEPSVISNLVANGSVYYVFRHYPFIDSQVTTKESHQAANASMCANEQGRFWDYKEMLFTNWNGENQGSFSDKRLTAFAETLGLDMNKFNACFKENRYKDQIQADFTAGQQAGVSGTPSVFVNGKIIDPGYIPTYDSIKKEVDTILASQ